MSRSGLIRSLFTIQSFPRSIRSFSCYNHCNYNLNNKPIFSPFFACLTLGSFFSYIQLVRSRNQFERLYLEIQELKKKLNNIEENTCQKK